MQLLMIMTITVLNTNKLSPDIIDGPDRALLFGLCDLRVRDMCDTAPLTIA